MFVGKTGKQRSPRRRIIRSEYEKVFGIEYAQLGEVWLVQAGGSLETPVQRKVEKAILEMEVAPEKVLSSAQ